MKITTAAALLISLGAAIPALAENPAQVKQLLETGVCQRCNLEGANLSGAHLIGVDLREANLRGANLENANLEGADLTGASLEGANLAGAFLNSAVLANTNLSWANLVNANLISADLQQANLASAELRGASVLMARLPIPALLANTAASQLRGTAERNFFKDTPLGIGGSVPPITPGYSQEDLNLVFPPTRANPSGLTQPTGQNQPGVTLWSW